MEGTGKGCVREQKGGEEGMRVAASAAEATGWTGGEGKGWAAGRCFAAGRCLLLEPPAAACCGLRFALAVRQSLGKWLL